MKVYYLLEVSRFRFDELVKFDEFVNKLIVLLLVNNSYPDR